MRILHVYKDYCPILGGIENHVRMLAEAEAAMGHQVTVLVTNPGGQRSREELGGVRIIRAWRLSTVASTPLSPTLPLLVGWLQSDITHLHFPYPIGELGQWLFGGNRPYVLSYHADVVRQRRLLKLYRPLMHRVLARADRLIAACEANRDSSADLSPYAGNCTIVPYGVETAALLQATASRPRGQLPTLLFVGKHRHYKGLDDLLKAMVGVEARLLVAGSGPLTESWKSLAGELALGDRVEFVGEVSDEALPGLYASADLFVLPSNSRAEFFGKVLLEAQAAGLPCLVTELGTGTSFVVQDGVSGKVVAPCSPEALRAGLRDLLADRERLREMGAAGRRRVLAEFTPEVMARRIQEVYQGVLARRLNHRAA